MRQNHGFLCPSDAVAITFWIISISMVASTVFFLMESMNVGYHWKTSSNVGSLVTLVAAVHYFCMREYWGPAPSVAHPLPLHRLVDYRAAADDRVLGLLGWFYILYEIFAGEAGNVSASGQNVNKHVQQSFKT